ncbi:MAG: hypothetical protein U1E77_17595 [Inhella sp.]
MLDALAGAEGDDAAARAPLAVVALPAQTDWPPWQGLLDALHYLLACTDGPVVALLALGCCWGPRGGRSAFERVLDRLLSAHPRLLVLWAGGSAERMAQAGLKGVMAAGQTQELSGPGQFGRAQTVGLWIRPAIALQWRVRPPASGWSAWLARAGSTLLPDGALAAARRCAGTTELLLQLPPRQATGRWRLEIHPAHACAVQAWLLEAPEAGGLRGAGLQRPRRAAWNGLAGSRRAVRVMEPGGDVPPGTLVWPLPDGGLAVLEGPSGALTAARGSSLAAACAARAVFAQLDTAKLLQPTRTDWLRLLRQAKAART